MVDKVARGWKEGLEVCKNHQVNYMTTVGSGRKCFMF